MLVHFLSHFGMFVHFPFHFSMFGHFPFRASMFVHLPFHFGMFVHLPFRFRMHQNFISVCCRHAAAKRYVWSLTFSHFSMLAHSGMSQIFWLGKWPDLPEKTDLPESRNFVPYDCHSLHHDYKARSRSRWQYLHDDRTLRDEG